MTDLLDKADLLKNAENYFNLLREKFIYTKKSDETDSTFGRIQILAFFIPLILCVVFPIMEQSEDIGFLKSNEYYIILKNYIKDEPIHSIFIIACSYILLQIVIQLIGSLINRKNESNSLDGDIYSFCLAFDSYIKLKNYLQSSQKEYIRSIVSSIDIYNGKISTTLDMIERDPGLRFHGNPLHQINHLQSEYNWFRVTDDTQTIASGFGKFPYLLKESLEKQINLNNILYLIELIVVYEYCKILAQSEKQDKNKVEIYGFLSILEFGKKTNELMQYDKKEEFKGDFVKLTKRFEKYKQTFQTGIESPRLIIRLLWWWLFWQIAIIMIVIFVVKISNVNLDGNIVSAMVATPVAGAIALAVKKIKIE